MSVLLVLIVGGVLTTGLWYGTRLTSLQITDVVVVGGATISEATVRNVVEQELVGDQYLLVPKRFAWWYPDASITAAVHAIPRVQHVRTERKGQTLVVAFDEYRPAALWCETVESQQCLFLDHAGYAFASAPVLIGSAFVRYVTVGTPPTVGASPLTPAYMDTTSSFIESLEDQLDLYVTHVVRTDEIDTAYVLSTGAEIRVTDRMSATETFTNLLSILNADQFSDISDGSFYYIDLRFGDKVFVSEAPPGEVATSTDPALIPDDFVDPAAE